MPPDGAEEIVAELVAVLAGELIPSALHVLGGEWLAIMPVDALSQLEREFGVALIPAPALGQVSQGTIVSGALSGALWSKTTRLLKSAMKGATVEMVASSWMEGPGGVHEERCAVSRPAFARRPGG